MNTNFGDVVFVGQAPSAESDPFEPLSGRSGAALAEMLEMPKDEFLKFARHNLNHCFPGKDGKGDAFDYDMGNIVAVTLASVASFKRYVLLGRAVAECFKMAWAPLYVWERGGKRFLLLPHPSGINVWYNNNRAKARKALREFVYE